MTTGGSDGDGVGVSDRGHGGVVVDGTSADGGSAGGSAGGGGSTGGAGGSAEEDEVPGAVGFVGSNSVGSPGTCGAEVDVGVSLRPVGCGRDVAEIVTVDVSVAVTRLVARSTARISLRCASTRTVSVTVEDVSSGSVHHWLVFVGRGGAGAPSGLPSGDPVNAINANIPPSARNGMMTTAPKHPRPLRGSSR